MGDPNTGEIYKGLLRSPHDVALDEASASALKALPSEDRIRKLQEMVIQNRTSGVSREMPRYKCHKEVYALKIAEIQPMYARPTIAELERLLEGGSHPEITPSGGVIGGYIIVPEDEGFAPFEVSMEFVQKHAPEAGGYYVTYDDGYKSYSPAKAFEDGYAKIA